MKSVAIIGAGACGMVLANLLSNDFEVTLLEKNNKLAKKILASGNGKCNFTNMGDYSNKYNNEFALNIVSKYDNECIRNYFSQLGLLYRVDEENRVYPLSESSNSVVDVLKDGLKKVKILLESKVEKLEDCNDGVNVYYNDSVKKFDYVVCCSGSSASNLGSDHAYNYLKEYGLAITELHPSLVAIRVKEDLKTINGVRVKCLVKLFKNNEFYYEEKGEVLFKEDALSGIVIYNISSIINRDFSDNYTIKLDLLSDAFNVLNNDNLVGSVHPKLVPYLKESGIKDLKNIEFKFNGLKDIKEAQVVSGGVSLKEINEDLSLVKNNRIYLGGEVLDCDGMCGGYNLQFAFSCAFSICESLKKSL